MSSSLYDISAQPNGEFEHAFSHTQFSIQSKSSGVWQTFKRADESGEQRLAYVIGSGAHAFGYLIQLDGHLFQSPLSYYTNRHAWDMAPGYERSTNPDFSRPVTLECLLCHSDKPLPIADTLNTYEQRPFAAEGISCDRCHGSVEAHLKKPVPGSIINPAKLTGAERDSICEQCHLAGEIRIPNPANSIADFRPGQRLEDVYTVYLAPVPGREGIKVISHAEQLALSTCARKSGGKLWCGTCHDPHNKPEHPAEYFRDRCLTCHSATLDQLHAAAGRDCVACHMPRLPARDGGHTAFTDHRIRARLEPETEATLSRDIRAWREPAPALQKRNLGLALITLGLENGSVDQALRGYRLLAPIQKDFQDDPAVLTTIGSLLLRAKQPTEALRLFEEAEKLRPAYAPFEVNVASALLILNQTVEAIQHLQKALKLDPLLQSAVELLNTAYRAQGQSQNATELIRRYQNAMGITAKTDHE